MKSILNKSIVLVAILTGFSFYAQNRDLSNYRQPDQRGVNVFEAPKESDSLFDGVKLRVGGASTLQYQALSHENANLAVDDGLGNISYPNQLQPIGSNFNLATANLDFDLALAKGLRMHLRTYLSSRHHSEVWVKGGYFQIDNLDFVSEGFMSGLMEKVTIKIGHMENNYGDAHFRRTDNAQAIYNPFVGNLIMDSFTTEVGAEVYYQNNGLIAMLGFTNGKLNQNVKNSNVKYDDDGLVTEEGISGGASFLAKLGYDSQISDDLRVRVTGSLYNTGYVPSSYLYSADRTGSRYYGVMIADGAKDNFRSGRYNPSFGNQVTAIMFNPFIKYKGLELFGTVEMAKGNKLGDDEKSATQLAGEVIYRFGKEENLYVGARYNTVTADDSNAKDWAVDDYKSVDISRFQIAAGWFMTKNILMKLEYVNQTYGGYADGTDLTDGKFNGLMAEAVISF